MARRCGGANGRHVCQERCETPGETVTSPQIKRTNSMSRCTAATLCLLLSMTALSSGGRRRACSYATAGLSSTEQSSEDNDRQVEFVNNAQHTLTVYWLDFAGREVPHGQLSPGATQQESSHLGHAYRLKDSYGSTFHELVVQVSGKSLVEHCGPVVDDLVEELSNHPRAEEFAALVHDQSAPCAPSSNSSEWSCLRCLTDAEVAARSVKDFGFLEGEAVGKRRVGQVLDDTYTKWIPHVPVLSQGPGYLKMNMTRVIHDALLPFYATQRVLARHEGTIGGSFANDQLHPFDFLSLDGYMAVRNQVSREMQDVMQWWTNQHLRHTATYGIRIYKRDAMLLNHVDRMETHLGSAVLQVDQNTDDNRGWPLEVMKPDGTTCEVYLQKGEMVLYEGARLRHGRPMRFHGDSFANVFAHFSPVSWHGKQTIDQNKRNQWQNERDQYL